MMFSGEHHNTLGSVNNNSNGFHDINLQQTLKRRRTDAISCECLASGSQVQFRKGNQFLSMPGSEFIYHTEVWKPKGGSLYLPLNQDVLINMSPVEQMSFETGVFFTANSVGEYQQTLAGSAVHFWRYDLHQKRLFISRSFLVTEPHVFDALRECLQSM